MDPFDRATQIEEQQRDEALHRRRPEAPAARGQCLFCEEPLPAEQRFCNTDCRDDWQRLQRARREAPQ